MIRSLDALMAAVEEERYADEASKKMLDRVKKLLRDAKTIMVDFIEGA